MAELTDDDFYNCDTLVDWLRENAPADLVIAPAKGVTVEMLIDRLDRIADREWSDGIDARGEDA